MHKVKSRERSSVANATLAAFQRYAPALHRYVLRRLRCPEDAPDLTQEIFERFLKADRADLIQNPQGYLFKIASHVVSESLCRDEQSLVTYDSDLAGVVSESAKDDAREELDDPLALQRDIQEALSALPVNHRIAVLLVKGEGLSYEEAATVSGFTVNTIGTYVTQARAKLKVILEDYGRSGKGTAK